MKKLLLLGTITVCSFSAFAQELYYYPSQNQQPIYFYQPTQIPQTQYVQTYTNPVKYKPIQSDFTKKYDTKVYISGKVKYNNTNADVKIDEVHDALNIKSIDDASFGGSIALGTTSKTPIGTLRAEIEYNKNSAAERDVQLLFNDLKEKLKIESQALLINGYYHFPTKTIFSPYISAGLGLARIKGSIKSTFDELTGDIKKTTFAYQGGFGISIDFTDHFSIDTGYRFIDYGSFKKNGIEIDTITNEIYTGARVSF
ncbi:MAG: porin family protein [Alphaproteobacteria bacterium]|nr:porin family protein [Alphaproteobacteria bacterium]